MLGVLGVASSYLGVGVKARAPLLGEGDGKPLVGGDKPPTLKHSLTALVGHAVSATVGICNMKPVFLDEPRQGSQ